MTPEPHDADEAANLDAELDDAARLCAAAFLAVHPGARVVRRTVLHLPSPRFRVEVEITARLTADSVDTIGRALEARAARWIHVLGVAPAALLADDGVRGGLQVIEGITAATVDDLRRLVAKHERALERDHCLRGEEQRLFTRAPDAAPDACAGVFWLPAGRAVERLVEAQVRSTLAQDGWREVRTPASKATHEREGCLWTRPCAFGHAGIFACERRPSAGPDIAIHSHAALFMAQDPTRRLDLRNLAEVRRDELSAYAPPERAGAHVASILALARRLYRGLGLDPRAVLCRPAHGAAVSIQAEAVARDVEAALAASGFARADPVACAIREPPPGEAAGIVFILPNVFGRLEHAAGALSVDLDAPRRAGLAFVSAGEAEQSPAVVQGTLGGCSAAIIAAILEARDGRLPLWLAPVQVLVVPTAGVFADIARRAHEQLASAGLRSVLDVRPESPEFKLRKAARLGIPYAVELGPREASAGTVSVRFGPPPHGPAPFDLSAVPRVIPIEELLAALAADSRPPC